MIMPLRIAGKNSFYSAFKSVFASKLAPTLDLCRSQIQCGSELAREGAICNTKNLADTLSSLIDGLYL
ncbi:hypothetical protein E4T63_04990 [Pseudomonas fluorescens]|uniref:Uncharacterized protein n=1 Tax=Pseudomonas fluorescens TaxID=294 RepID=A0AAP9CH63_PSEFL|nr:hypothetical protein E3Z29_07535 [Pseudomonas sp. S150]QBX39972.1 hypothetical protein E4T63_04990 [Pseudomonas fluorescens]